jgi:hypothetical protein
MMLWGLCLKCSHRDVCKLRLEACLLDNRNNTFNCEADVVHCKQFKEGPQ